MPYIHYIIHSDKVPLKFQNETYPGKTLIRYTTLCVPYPLFIVDEEVASLDWLGETATLFKGRHAELEREKYTETPCYAINLGDVTEYSI